MQRLGGRARHRKIVRQDQGSWRGPRLIGQDVGIGVVEIRDFVGPGFACSGAFRAEETQRTTTKHDAARTGRGRVEGIDTADGEGSIVSVGIASESGGGGCGSAEGEGAAASLSQDVGSTGGHDGAVDDSFAAALNRVGARRGIVGTPDVPAGKRDGAARVVGDRDAAVVTRCRRRGRGDGIVAIASVEGEVRDVLSCFTSE